MVGSKHDYTSSDYSAGIQAYKGTIGHPVSGIPDNHYTRKLGFCYNLENKDGQSVLKMWVNISHRKWNAKMQTYKLLIRLNYVTDGVRLGTYSQVFVSTILKQMEWGIVDSIHWILASCGNEND